MSKRPETRKYSDKAGKLTQEELGHKQAVWGMVVAAKEQHQHATFHGCDVYTGGNLVGPHRRDAANLQEMTACQGWDLNQALAHSQVLSCPQLPTISMTEPPACTCPQCPLLNILVLASLSEHDCSSPS